MKLFVMSDIHGDYKAMMAAIKESGYDKKNPDHQIVVIGDYFGRATTGKGPYGIWRYLISNTHKNKPICIKGNHEEYFVAKMLEKGFVSDLDEQNGEDKTILSFFANIKNINKDPDIMDPVYDYLNSLPDKPEPDKFYDRYFGKSYEEEVCAVNMLGEGKQLKEWCDNLPYYFETKNYVFTHGWLPYRQVKKSPKLSDYNYDMVYDYKKLNKYSDEDWHHWIWTKTPFDYAQHCSYFPNGWDKWIVVGHWHAFAFGPRAEFFDGWWSKEDVKPEEYNYVVDEKHKVIFCDHCTVYGHKINMLVLEDELLDE